MNKFIRSAKDVRSQADQDATEPGKTRQLSTDLTARKPPDTESKPREEESIQRNSLQAKAATMEPVKIPQAADGPPRTKTPSSVKAKRADEKFPRVHSYNVDPDEEQAKGTEPDSDDFRLIVRRGEGPLRTKRMCVELIEDTHQPESTPNSKDGKYPPILRLSIY